MPRGGGGVGGLGGAWQVIGQGTSNAKSSTLSKFSKHFKVMNCFQGYKKPRFLLYMCSFKNLFCIKCWKCEWGLNA